MNKQLKKRLQTLLNKNDNILELMYFKYYQNREATLLVTPKAYIQLTTVIAKTDKEIGWQGIVSRKDETTFLLEAIKIPPQVVTGVSVRTDEEELLAWYVGIPDSTLCKMKLQGHSHVSMDVAPSTQDRETQELMEKQSLDFNITMIGNKSNKFFIEIYDKENFYKTSNVHLRVIDTTDIMKEVENNLKEAQHTTRDWKIRGEY